MHVETEVLTRHVLDHKPADGWACALDHEPVQVWGILGYEHGEGWGRRSSPAVYLTINLRRGGEVFTSGVLDHTPVQGWGREGRGRTPYIGAGVGPDAEPFGLQFEAAPRLWGGRLGG